MRRFEEMYQPYLKNELMETVSNMYEFTMCNMGSILGNRGEYDRSDRHTWVILRECLAYRRLEVIKTCLYNRWWNYDKRRSEGIPNAQKLDDREELGRCIAFADMAKDTKRKQFYQRKLKEIESDAAKSPCPSPVSSVCSCRGITGTAMTGNLPLSSESGAG